MAVAPGDRRLSGAGAMRRRSLVRRLGAVSVMTSTVSSAAALTTFQRSADAASSVLAQLPAQLLHIAAHFASDDPCKEALTVVHVACVDVAGDVSAHLRIAATNGHYAFRCRLPVGDSGAFDDPAAPFWCGVPELFLKASAFRKRPAYALQALIRADGEARLFGARKGEAVALLEARPIGDPVPQYPSPFPPGFDGLFPVPAGMACAPGAAMGWNSAYMGDICAIAKRYSPNGVLRFHAGASPTAPVLLTCDLELGGGAMAPAEFLLMPVQFRD